MAPFGCDDRLAAGGRGGHEADVPPVCWPGAYDGGMQHPVPDPREPGGDAEGQRLAQRRPDGENLVEQMLLLLGVEPGETSQPPTNLEAG